MFTKQTLIIFTLMCSMSAAVGQVKITWKQNGGLIYRDTVTKFYYATNMKYDSISYEVEKQDCKCAVFTIKSGSEIKTMPCDSLVKSHQVEQHWEYQKEITSYKEKIIRTTAPRYVISWGTSSLIDWVYYYNNRRVYPLELYNQPVQR